MAICHSNAATLKGISYRIRAVVVNDESSALRRQLGLAAVMAVVMGDMLGSGIFFTPGSLA
ncbi:MAG: hypothetical protein ACRD21_29755, partial [Vicinamibacteria bacterium]